MSGYISNVPLPTQSLGQTNSTIKNNFTVINTNFGVDHSDMTNAAPSSGGTGGWHNTVTLIQQSGDPAAQSNAPIIYSKQTAYPAGVNKTDVYLREASTDGSAIIALTSFFGSLSTGTNGTTFLPGVPGGSSAGVILKWGQASSNGGPNPITFAGLGLSNFPNNCFMVVASVNDAGATPNTTIYVSSFSPTGFNATGAKRTTLAPINVIFNFIAIGN